MEFVRKGDTRDGVYRFSPANAAVVLENAERNRPLRANHVRTLAAAMKAGDWVENGEVIIFDDQGCLLDGQHRLHACILAGRTFTSHCVWVNPKKIARVFDTMDAGQNRNVGERFALDGALNASLLAGIVRAILMIETGGGLTKNRAVFTVSECAARLHLEEKEITETVAAVKRYQKDFRRVVAMSPVGAVYHLARKQDAEKADNFLRQLATGEHLASGNAVFNLRRRLMEQSRGAMRFKIRDLMALLIKSWCLYRDGVTMKVLVWKSEESFPSMEVSNGKTSDVRPVDGARSRRAR